MIRLALAGIALGVLAGLLVSVALPVHAPDYPTSIPPCSAYAETSHPKLAPGSRLDACWYVDITGAVTVSHP